MEGLPRPTNFTRSFPETDDELARKSYALHGYMTIRLVEELRLDLARRYEGARITAPENEAINLAVDLMISEGMLELVDAPTSES